jgi:isocitrate/isopropylmalate dehydrogenase
VLIASLTPEHLGEGLASARLLASLEGVCRDGPRTRDLGGSAGTAEVGAAIRARL